MEAAELSRSGIPVVNSPTIEKEAQLAHPTTEKSDASSVDDLTESDAPTEEDLHNLERVSGKIPWTAYTIAFIELCERFSYYGTTAVFVNFIQQPLPPGSRTGAGFSGQSGALNMGQRASTGLTTCMFLFSTLEK